METKPRKLPIGIQTFDKIREGNYVYVDKTEYLVNLIDSEVIYFYARPRRFGKSLTVSTLDAMFSGKKELFKGLYVEEFMNRPDYRPSPVIRLDMSKITTSEGIQGVKDSIGRLTLAQALIHKVEVERNIPCGEMLDQLVYNICEQNGNG
ncbi:MAG: AAA family ATPase, partial [Tannerella sp.]|nr:AAA family ATPase [Tannerella sp.]